MTARDRARTALDAIACRAPADTRLPSVDGMADAIATVELWEVPEDEKLARAVIAYLAWQQKEAR